MPSELHKEGRVAERMSGVFEAFEDEPVLGRLRVRLRELGRDQRDELLQFRLLQRACREEPRLGEALCEAGFDVLAEAGHGAISPEGGSIVQVFNRMIEERWEDW